VESEDVAQAKAEAFADAVAKLRNIKS